MPFGTEVPVRAGYKSRSTPRIGSWRPTPTAQAREGGVGFFFFIILPFEVGWYVFIEMI